MPIYSLSQLISTFPFIHTALPKKCHQVAVRGLAATTTTTKQNVGLRLNKELTTFICLSQHMCFDQDNCHEFT